MKKTNKELLQYDEFWKNNNEGDIRYIVNKFIEEYEEKIKLLDSLIDQL